ncbi:MAG: C-terminal binding protein [Clostridiales bacterium]|jgi:D-3-phosphoglycerate dehydrogenase|nr:C-terminal binding protein [Clostridiales bacterium]
MSTANTAGAAGATATVGIKVIICDCDHENVENERRVFEAAGLQFRWLHCETQDEVIEQCVGAAVLLNQYVRMDRYVFERLPTLKCVVRYGVGVDNVNLADASEFGVQVCNVPDYGVNEVADHALALMLALDRRVLEADAFVKSGRWDYTKIIPVYRHSEQTVGIVGVGRIGTAFAQRVRSLGCRLLGTDIEYGRPGRVFPDFVEFVTLEELLRSSDVVSLHCSLTELSADLICDRTLALMKRSAYLVNVSRGGLVDEGALARALRSGAIAGAAADVLKKEPMGPGHAFLSIPNLILTPHMAWYSEQSAEEMKRKCAEEAVRFLRGERVRCPVNKI